MSEPVHKSGLFASIAQLSATALEMAQVRLNLLGTELELEKRRIFDGLLWGAISLLILGVGFVLLCAFVILLFEDRYRVAAVGVMALLCLAGSVLLMYKLQRRLRNPNGMFNASAEELERDRTSIKESAPHEQR